MVYCSTAIYKKTVAFNFILHLESVKCKNNYVVLVHSTRIVFTSYKYDLYTSLSAEHLVNLVIYKFKFFTINIIAFKLVVLYVYIIELYIFPKNLYLFCIIVGQ